MLGVLRRLAAGRARIVDGGGLADFLAGRAAFVSQKSALDYCRARAGIGWAQLFREDEFGRAIERCRWEAYAAVLADVGEVALIYLRHCGGEGRGSRRGSAEALRRGPASGTRSPAHRPTGTRPASPRRRGCIGPCWRRRGRCIGSGAAPRGKVFDVLPIHTNLKAHDREMVVNNVRFLLCRVYADMEAQLDGPALVRELTEPGRAIATDRHQRRDEGSRGAQRSSRSPSARACRPGSSPRPAPPTAAMPICRKPPRPEAAPGELRVDADEGRLACWAWPRLARRRRGWSAGTGPRATRQPASSSASEQQRAGQRAQAAQQDHPVAADPGREACRGEVAEHEGAGDQDRTSGRTRWPGGRSTVDHQVRGGGQEGVEDRDREGALQRVAQERRRAEQRPEACGPSCAPARLAEAGRRLRQRRAHGDEDQRRRGRRRPGTPSASRRGRSAARPAPAPASVPPPWPW